MFYTEIITVYNEKLVRHTKRGLTLKKVCNGVKVLGTYKMEFCG
jgi:hypothetical protein